MVQRRRGQVLPRIDSGWLKAFLQSADDRSAFFDQHNTTAYRPGLCVIAPANGADFGNQTGSVRGAMGARVIRVIANTT
jgi:hypothetical protein